MNRIEEIRKRMETGFYVFAGASYAARDMWQLMDEIDRAHAEIDNLELIIEEIRPQAQEE